jgi:hypothetical protein
MRVRLRRGSRPYPTATAMPRKRRLSAGGLVPGGVGAWVGAWLALLHFCLTFCCRLIAQ